MEIKSNF